VKKKKRSSGENQRRKSAKIISSERRRAASKPSKEARWHRNQNNHAYQHGMASKATVVNIIGENSNKVKIAAISAKISSKA